MSASVATSTAAAPGSVSCRKGGLAWGRRERPRGCPNTWGGPSARWGEELPVSYTHLRAHETSAHL
eukprot:6128104-Alexandrium_andersonii.AAC.1